MSRQFALSEQNNGVLREEDPAGEGSVDHVLVTPWAEEPLRHEAVTPAITTVTEVVDPPGRDHDAAFEMCYQKFAPVVTEMARKFVGPNDADDLSQEVFIDLYGCTRYRSLEQLNELFGVTASYSAFLYTITIRQAKDYFRHRYAQKRDPRLAVEIDEDHGDGTSCSLDLVLDTRCLEKAREHLQWEQRMAHVLFYDYDFTHAEIAEFMSTSESNSRTLVCRARKKLQRLLKVKP